MKSWLRSHFSQGWIGRKEKQSVIRKHHFNFLSWEAWAYSLASWGNEMAACSIKKNFFKVCLSTIPAKVSFIFTSLIKLHNCPWTNLPWPGKCNILISQSKLHEFCFLNNSSIEIKFTSHKVYLTPTLWKWDMEWMPSTAPGLKVGEARFHRIKWAFFLKEGWMDAIHQKLSLGRMNWFSETLPWYVDALSS